MAEKKTFYQHFKYSMDSLGLPTPVSAFGTITTATSTISGLAALVTHFGKTATIAEIVATAPAGATSAPVLIELAKVVGGCALAFYVGACIGALAYATGEWTSDRLWANNHSTAKTLNSVAAKYKIPIDKDYMSAGPRSFLARADLIESFGGDWRVA